MEVSVFGDLCLCRIMFQMIYQHQTTPCHKPLCRNYAYFSPIVRIS